MAIAWMYREDYARAGYLVLPLNQERDRYLIGQSFAVSLLLLEVSLLPAIYEKSSLVYFAGALMIGTIFSYYSARLAFRKSNTSARQLLVASILYLPALFVLMMLHRK
jgi:protoheme IX farnesyltransferase